MSRTTAREVSMKLAFARMFGGDDTYAAVLDQSGIKETPVVEDVEFADELLRGIDEQSERLDEIIGELAIDWKLERMPKVDICILRIAVYEMLNRSDIPNSVSINEAVELAKQFGGEHSSAFINGLLGTLAKRLEADEHDG